MMHPKHHPVSWRFFFDDWDSFDRHVAQGNDKIINDIPQQPSESRAKPTEIHPWIQRSAQRRRTEASEMFLPLLSAQRWTEHCLDGLAARVTIQNRAETNAKRCDFLQKSLDLGVEKLKKLTPNAQESRAAASWACSTRLRVFVIVWRRCAGVAAKILHRFRCKSRSFGENFRKIARVFGAERAAQAHRSFRNVSAVAQRTTSDHALLRRLFCARHDPKSR